MRIVIAEDQFLLRQGLENLFTRHGFEVVAAVDDGPSLTDAVLTHRPDVALIDIRMPPTFTDEGLRAAVQIRKQIPGQPVLILSQYVERLYVDELHMDGGLGTGYLLKDRVFDDAGFVRSVKAVAAGGVVVDPETLKELMEHRAVQQRLERLTSRELEVLTLMAEGLSNGDIAEKLFVAEKTVAKHINTLFAKLDLPDTNSNARRVQAVLHLLRNGGQGLS